MFKVLKTAKKSSARLGELKTAHGKIFSPFFMPIATRGTVKSLLASELKDLQSQIILSNTYHLYLRPGLKILRQAGGLHKLMAWSGPILTDSGGYQVFSLGKMRQLTKSGVIFRSTYDGSKHLFTPAKVLAIQDAIGSDLRMVLDVCSPSQATFKQAEKDLALTLTWAKAAKKIYQRQKKDYLLLGIVQGALHQSLRQMSARELVKLNFPGYAIGGLAVGETAGEMYQVLDYTVPILPANKPRYLMGVGYPEQIVEAVKRGVDMFDCVIPTREARHGRLYYFAKVAPPKCQTFKQLFKNHGYYTINITARQYAEDFSAINQASAKPELKSLSKAYLRHLFSVNEQLAQRLATLNNVEFYLTLMLKIRQAIKNNQL